MPRKYKYQGHSSSNHSNSERECNDFYVTPPKAVELLLKEEVFADKIWECACGTGEISKVLENYKYNVLSTDLIDRGYGKGGIDFLTINDIFDGDIITNPPYKYANDFLIKALNTIKERNKVAFFLKLQFLESVKRYEIFKKYPPKKVYVSVKRLACAKNGDFNDKNATQMAHAWFIWQKGFKGNPIVKWFNY